jgi:hypothetical protein
MTLACQLIAIAVVSLLGAIAWGIARWRCRSRQIREEQSRHWAVHERACAAKGLPLPIRARSELQRGHLVRVKADAAGAAAQQTGADGVHVNGDDTAGWRSSLVRT